MTLDRKTKRVVVAAAITELALLFTAMMILSPLPAARGEGQGEGRRSLIAPSPVIFTPSPIRRAPTVNLGVPYESLIHDAARRHQLPPHLIAAMTRVESDFDPRGISHKGARGLMQVMPETGARFGVAPDALFDPERNIAAGTAYMRWLLDRYGGDLDLALAGYNAGEGAVDKYGGIPPYPETQNYVRKVRSVLHATIRSGG